MLPEEVGFVHVAASNGIRYIAYTGGYGIFRG
jgi:hypothetical protein